MLFIKWEWGLRINLFSFKLLLFLQKTPNRLDLYSYLHIFSIKGSDGKCKHGHNQPTDTYTNAYT